MTHPNAGEALAYTLFDYESARALEELPISQREAAAAAGRVTKTKFFASATLTPQPFYTTRSKVLAESLKILNQFEQLLTDHCGKEAPGFSKLRQRLIDAEQLTRTILKERPTPETQEQSSEAPLEEEPQHHHNRHRSGPIQNRREAYQRLAEAAEYLQKTEPHSPTPYLIKRAISWGEMSLTELLLELVNDERDLATIYNLLGIKKPPKK